MRNGAALSVLPGMTVLRARAIHAVVFAMAGIAAPAPALRAADAPSLELDVQVEQYDGTPDDAGRPVRPKPGDGWQSDYWIVSSRRCPQDIGGCRAGCPMEYYYRSADGHLHRRNSETFANWLEPGIPLCVIVHGSFVGWDGIVEQSPAMFRWMRRAAPDRPIQVVFFSWPSESPRAIVPNFDIGILGRRSARNGMYLSRLLSDVPPETPVTFVGHSHGARVVSGALHFMGGGSIEECPPDPAAIALPHRVRAVLLAAAIDHHWLDPGQQYGRALVRADSIVNMKNRGDTALSFYTMRSFVSAEALARIGWTARDRARMGWLSAKAIEIDISNMVGWGHMWHHYSSRPAIARTMMPYVYYADASSASPSAPAPQDRVPVPPTPPASPEPLPQIVDVQPVINSNGN